MPLLSAQGGQPVCAVCVAPAIRPGQALLLPENLHGLTVVVVDHAEALQAIATAVDEIRVRAGRPAVLVAARPEVEPNRRLFALKTRFTELRAALGTDVRLTAETGADEALAGYVDALVGTAAARASGPPIWPRLQNWDVERALAATTSGGAERWVVDAPPDVLSARAMLRRLAGAAAARADAFTDEIEVRGTRRLTVEEIVARHQAFARGQAVRTARTIAAGLLTLTFEAPGFPAPVTVTSDTIIYSAPGQTDLEQRAIRVNGISFESHGVPRLPILEPERVSSPPLAITLGAEYRYRLLGEAKVDGVDCHVVAFDPADDTISLFRGRAWIARDTFAMVRVSAAQTQLRGPIVSSEQVDEFRARPDGLWLLARSEVHQIYEGAGHRTPIHRTLILRSHEIDPPDFDARLRAAYASASVMLRDTPAGYRYLERAAAAAGEAPERLPRMTVARPATRVRTIAAGVIVDPNISFPLPFAGLSYVDFDLFDTGAQLNAFFGGTYGQVAFSIPSLGRSKWQLAGRASGIASSYNDRAFRGGREIYEENLRQRPAHASAWLLHPVSSRLTVRAGYEFDYTRLAAGEQTATAFAVPANEVVHSARLALEGQRAGWSGSVWWSPAWRTGWRTWGRMAEDYSPRHATFQRYGASVSRSSAVRPALATHVEAAIMAGSDLDRFSRFSFGAFDNRLRGYPSALIRYDRGGVVRGAVAWSPGRAARLDGFLDSAVVRDRGFDGGYRNYTGVGAALEIPAPFGILGAIEWGYGFRGLDADGGRGTHVMRVSAFKIF